MSGQIPSDAQYRALIHFVSGRELSVYDSVEVVRGSLVKPNWLDQDDSGTHRAMFSVTVTGSDGMFGVAWISPDTVTHVLPIGPQD